MAKIYVFSGDDIVSSRQAYTDQIEILKKENETEYVNAKDIDEISLENIFGSLDLFGKNRILATENFFSGQKTKSKESLIDKILSFPQAVFISWEEKTTTGLGKGKNEKDFVIKDFKIPNVLWKFLDDLSPNNKPRNLQTLHKITTDLDPHFIFSMIIRQFRLLILSSDSQEESLPPWQRRKLKNQAASFGQEKLIQIYKKLLNIDIRQKTSGSAYDISGELDLLIVNL